MPKKLTWDEIVYKSSQKHMNKYKYENQPFINEIGRAHV